MRRLPLVDKILLATLVPLWVVCFGLSVQTVLRGDHIAHLTVLAPESADDYPTVAGLRPYAASEPDLRAGDRLLRVGDVDLRGTSPFQFQIEVLGETQGLSPVPVR